MVKIFTSGTSLKYVLNTALHNNPKLYWKEILKRHGIVRNTAAVNLRQFLTGVYVVYFCNEKLVNRYEKVVVPAIFSI